VIHFLLTAVFRVVSEASVGILHNLQFSIPNDVFVFSNAFFYNALKNYDTSLTTLISDVCKQIVDHQKRKSAKRPTSKMDSKQSTTSIFSDRDFDKFEKEYVF